MSTSSLNGASWIREEVSPITGAEREERVVKARQLMVEEGLDAIVLEAGPNLHYFTGIRWERSDRIMVAVIPARGAIGYVCPRFEEARLREMVLADEDVRVWEEHENPSAEVAGLLSDRGIARGRVASFEALDMTVVQLQEDRVHTEERLVLAAQRAIQEANAEVLILGCTREFGFYRVLQDKLGVPVIDGLLAALSYAEHMIRLRERHGWRHSKIGVYASPPQDECIDWVDDARYHEEVWGLARGDG